MCDLYSSAYLAWVFNRHGNLEDEYVEHAAASAAVDGREAIIFVRGGILPTAYYRADDLGVALLRFDSYDGDLFGGNARGHELCVGGMVSDRRSSQAINAARQQTDPDSQALPGQRPRHLPRW
ncbi:hypothetical protein GCM10022286_24910 [Gryllotalpicola daejeonensis]|uniref:Glutamine amidotransferase type-2 domain-containing protein n=1 Tax=Gryllotalpicola daejeonensis TaxID=993087 RepID=A0ABP7ZM16_9MICO